MLKERSGLLGLSGISADLREVITARDAGAVAALAVDVLSTVSLLALTG